MVISVFIISPRLNEGGEVAHSKDKSNSVRPQILSSGQSESSFYFLSRLLKSHCNFYKRWTQVWIESSVLLAQVEPHFQTYRLFMKCGLVSSVSFCWVLFNQRANNNFLFVVCLELGPQGEKWRKCAVCTTTTPAADSPQIKSYLPTYTELIA